MRCVSTNPSQAGPYGQSTELPGPTMFQLNRCWEEEGTDTLSNAERKYSTPSSAITHEAPQSDGSPVGSTATHAAWVTALPPIKPSGDYRVSPLGMKPKQLLPEFHHPQMAGAKPVSILEIRQWQCHVVVGRDESGLPTYCGLRTIDGPFRFCQFHAERSLKR